MIIHILLEEIIFTAGKIDNAVKFEQDRRIKITYIFEIHSSTSNGAIYVRMFS